MESMATILEAERFRIKTITHLGEKLNQPTLAEKLISSGASLEDAQNRFKEASYKGHKKPTGIVDLSPKEQRKYSVARAITACVTGDWKDAGLEKIVSDELATQFGRATAGFFIPNNLKTRATYAAGAAATGGRLIQTDVPIVNFIDALRAASVISSLNPTMLTGLIGNVDIPRGASATQTYWVTENTDLTQAEATFDRVQLTPKQVGSRSKYSRFMLQQTSGEIENIIRSDLAAQIGLAIDLAAINGSGQAGQPTGILNTTGVGNFELGANANTGAALADASATAKSGLEPYYELEALVDSANGNNISRAYLTNSKVIAATKKLKSSTTFEPLWTGDRDNTSLGTPIVINGSKVAKTNLVPSNLIKGSSQAIHSALIFGDFSDLIIGLWGALEILPNPYGSGFNAGTMDIRIMQTCDIALRQPASFAAIKDIVA